jgi:formylglycine-generating enzyme required for sulfatase activity
MNLTSQYITNPKCKKVYNTSVASRSPIKFSSTRLRLRCDRLHLNFIFSIFRYNFCKIDNVSFRMIKCPIGITVMGAGSLHAERSIAYIEQPFLLGETEVTQELFEAVMGYNPSRFQGVDYPNSNQRPVESVTWCDAVLFCNKLSERLGRRPYYKTSNFEYVVSEQAVIFTTTIDPKANGFRLPLQKEWEFAARATTNNRWAGTDDEDKIKQVAWFGEEANNQTHPVKHKHPNKWGFYDMTGNVSEWCSDLHKKRYATTLSSVRRGGSWNDDAPRTFSIGDREFSSLSEAYSTTGFRIALYISN